MLIVRNLYLFLFLLLYSTTALGITKNTTSQKNSNKEKFILNYYDTVIDSLTSHKLFDKKDINNVLQLIKASQQLTVSQHLKFNNYLAYYHLINLNFKESIQFCQKNLSLRFPKNKNNELTIAYTYYFYGNCLLNQGNYKKAIQYSQFAIKTFEKHKFVDGWSKCKMLLANIYFYLKSYKDAENEINEGIQLFQQNKTNNYYMLVLTKIKILRAFKVQESISEIIKTYQELKNKPEIDDFFKIEINVYYIEFLINNNKLELAKKIIDETQPLVEKKNTIRSSDMFNWILADYNFATNSPLSNKSYFLNRITKSKKENDHQTLRNIYYYLKQDAYLSKNLEDLYYYTNEYELASKKISSDETKSEILELKTKYETEKKEQLLALNELQIDKKNRTIIILFSTSLTFILFGLFIYSNFKNYKRKENEELKKHFTVKLLENMEEERKRIAKELHDGINHELLTLKHNKPFSEHEINNKIDQIIEDVRSISRNLHPVMFEKIGLESSVKNLIERLKINNNFFITSEISYTNCLHSKQEIQLFRVIQEGLNNIIKYSNAHAAKVTLVEKEDFLYLEIKDNGIGFKFEEQLKSKKSFGIHSIIERIHSINGEIKFISNQSGTTIKIKIKK